MNAVGYLGSILPTTYPHRVGAGMNNQLQRWLGFLLIGIGVVLVGAGLYGFTRQDQYEARATVQIERFATLDDLDDSPGIDGARDYESYSPPTTEEIFCSEPILSNVIARLNLDAAWSERYYQGQKLKLSESIFLLRSRLSVRQRTNTTLVDISAVSEDQTEVASIANAVVDSFCEWRSQWGADQMRKHGARGLAALKKQLDEQNPALIQLSNRVIQLRQELQIPETETLRSEFPVMITSGIGHDPVAQVREEIRKYDGQKETLENLQKLDREQLINTLPAYSPDAALSELIVDVHACSQEIQNTSTNQAGQRELLERELVSLQNRLDKRIAVVLQNLDKQVKETKERVEQLEAKGDTQRLLAIRKPFYDAQREFQDKTDVQKLLRRKIRIKEEAMNFTPASHVHSVEKAVAPSTPIRHNKRIGSFCFAAGWLCFGWGVLLVKNSPPFAQ